MANLKLFPLRPVFCPTARENPCFYREECVLLGVDGSKKRAILSLRTASDLWGQTTRLATPAMALGDWAFFNHEELLDPAPESGGIPKDAPRERGVTAGKIKRTGRIARNRDFTRIPRKGPV